MKKFIITQGIDYISGHLRYGHFECEIEANNLEEAKEIAKTIDLKEEGKLIIDDYAINDYGDLQDDIEVVEVNDEN